MIEQFATIFEQIGVWTEAILTIRINISAQLVGALIVIVSAITSIAAISRNHQFEKLKWSGVPRTAALTLQSSLLAIALLGAGLGLIAVLKGDIPEWASTGIPGAVAIVALVFVLGEVVLRPTFTLQRFWDYAIFPMLAPLLALAAFSLPALSGIIEGLLS